MNPFSTAPRLPKATKILLIVIVAVFLIQLISRQFLGVPLEQILGFRPNFFVQGHIYQLLTYPFLHGSLTHILFNCLILYSIGSTLEYRWGTKKFLRFYGLCAIGGAILQTLCWLIALVAGSSESAAGLGNISVIGASGALYGLFMAFGKLYGNAQVLVFFVFPMKAKHFVALMAGIEFVSAVFSGNPAMGGGIAHLVHLGGLITGFVYLKLRGPDLNGRGGGGGFFRRRPQDMSHEEIRRRLRVVVDNDNPKTGDKNYPITWN